MVRTRSTGGRAQRRRHRDPDEVARAVTELFTLATKALQQQWQRSYGTGPPPGLGRALLLRMLAYQIQETAFGGLTPATRRFLRDCGDPADAPTRSAAPARTKTPGTVLVREWRGTSHRVTVLDHGCTWRGTRYRSLSEVARAITGARWSGPRFFGLAQAQEEARNGTRDR